jgi:hypothetical protein
MNPNNDKDSLKRFFIKLIAITFSIIVIINVTYNLIFAEKLETLEKILSINDKENIDQIKDKVRKEIKKGLLKDKVFNDDDRILLQQFYLKIQNEFKDLEK